MACERSALPSLCPFSLTKTKMSRETVYLLSVREEERKVVAQGPCGADANELALILMEHQQ